MMKACDRVKPHFGSLVGCIFWPTCCAFLWYFRIDGAKTSDASNGNKHIMAHYVLDIYRGRLVQDGYGY